MGTNDILRLSVAKTYLSPSYYEMNYQGSNVLSNPSLTASEMQVTDLSWEHQDDMLGRVVLSGYTFDAKGLIRIVSENDILQYQNVDGAKGTGVSAQWQKSWSGGWNWQ